MISDAFTPLLIIFFLGAILGKTGFLKSTWINIAIEVLYQTAIPIVILWEILSNKNISSFIGSNWEFLALLSIFSLGTLYFSIKIFQISNQNNLAVLLKLFILLGLILSDHLLNSLFMSHICIVYLLILPLTDILLEQQILCLAKNHEEHNSEVKQCFKYFAFHPVILAGLLGFFLANNTSWLEKNLENTVYFIYPMLLPLTLIVVGAKISHSHPLRMVRKLIHKHRR